MKEKQATEVVVGVVGIVVFVVCYFFVAVECPSKSFEVFMCL